MQMIPGQMLSNYRLVEKIGEGGMGVVYRAHDERLDRDVAIKVLPETVAQDAERLARFEREARSLASLSHQNIATLYGLEEHEGKRFLVMELAEGETLARRLGRGPMPPRDAVEVAREIAEGLEAAHERGIVHRDLKPANVMLSPEGRVKILDFGLAKTWQPEEIDADSTHSPTLTARMTSAGVLLGTAAYMSPEQARGKPVDKRADIWAFGCCLYEMLTGKRLFTGATVSDVLAAVLREEPDLAALPSEVEPWLRTLLCRCLEREPRQRLRDIGEARVMLERTGSESEEIPGRRSGSRGIRVWISVAGIAVALIAGWSLRAWIQGREEAARFAPTFTVRLPDGVRFYIGVGGSTTAISRDGRIVAFTARERDTGRLYLRRLDSLEITPLTGTEGADFPFFSPDGRAVAFFADLKLKRLDLDGGPPVVLCDMGTGGAGSWGPDGTIVFNGDWESGLSAIPGTGGTPRPLTEPADGELGHWWPQILPGGKHVLFTVWRTDLGNIGVSVASLETGERKELLRGGSYARYVPPGLLVYAQAGRLMAVRFDLDRLALEGHPVPVLEGVDRDLRSGLAFFEVSQSGTLLYRLGGDWFARRRIVWVDREGRATPVGLPAGGFLDVALSPDGKRLATTIFEDGNATIHVHELASGTTSQITFHGFDMLPVWSPDGTEIAFTTFRNGPFSVYAVPAVPGATERPLIIAEEDRKGADWAPDGSVILVGSAWEFLAPGGDQPPVPFAPMPGVLEEPSFSPDGRWIAFQSYASGHGEVYVVGRRDGSAVQQISTGGGDRPLWSPKGDELFYANGKTVMAVEVRAEGERFVAGRPRRLFDFDCLVWGAGLDWSYDAENERFLMVERGDQETWTDRFAVVVNWSAELERLVPAR